MGPATRPCTINAYSDPTGKPVRKTRRHYPCQKRQEKKERIVTLSPWCRSVYRADSDTTYMYQEGQKPETSEACVRV